MQETAQDIRHKVLVVGSDPRFLEKAEQVLNGPAFEVIAVPEVAKAPAQARELLPAVIVLGHTQPPGSVFELYRQLRTGWVTRRIPVLAVDLSPGEESGWNAEPGMVTAEGTYTVLSGTDAIPVSRLFEPPALVPLVENAIRATANTFRQALLSPDVFCVTWEQIPGRGAVEKQQDDALANARRAAADGKIHAISVTDNPGGNPALSTGMLCTEIKRLGIEPLVHLACRDKNRNEMESTLHGLAAAGVRNLLILTGDYPSSEGFTGRPKPVFDIDAVQTLQLVTALNGGLPHPVSRRKTALTPTDFFAGACVSPFKITEAELLGQYYKLKKKIEAGAAFIITQVGYDARKMHEVLQWLRLNGYRIPVMANIYVLPLGAARLMNSNQIPGCVVTDKLVAELAAEAKAEDKGRQARLLRAAKMYALAKGMGFAGAHIGGHGITYEQASFIITKGEELAPGWQELVAEFDYPQERGFYFFQPDPATRLNREVPAERPSRPGKPLMYRFSRLAHHLLFNDKSPLFPVLRPVARFFDAGRRRRHFFGFFEHLVKVALFGCMNCGDCALMDVAYLCPMSQCPKNQRNAPCGGSYDGWCEVYPNEKKCVWVKAYERLKAYGEEDTIGSYIVPPCNWELWQTPSWLNFYLGRDHSARRLGIKPPEPKTKGGS